MASSDTKDLIYIIKEDSKIIGYIISNISFLNGFYVANINPIVINPAYLRNGYASSVIEELMNNSSKLLLLGLIVNVTIGFGPIETPRIAAETRTSFDTFPANTNSMYPTSFASSLSEM